MGVTTKENGVVRDSKLKHSFFGVNGKTTSPFFQTKLMIGSAENVYEREADAVAEKVVSGGDHSQNRLPISSPNVQRKCAACEEEHVQRKEGSGSTLSEAPSIVSDALNSTAGPLDNTTKSFMEDRFGYDFSAVKIHTNATAAKSAQSINALAYTSGNNIVFNEGQYSPDSNSGKKLLAHELTHVVQQSSGIVRRYGHDNFCDQSTRLEPFIWPGHARALSMLQNVLAALQAKDSKVMRLVPVFFGKGAESHLPEIIKKYESMNKAVQENYMYHCNDASNKNKNSGTKKCHGQRAETDLDSLCISNCRKDITLCFDVITSAWTPTDVGALIIHENFHRAFGGSAHPRGLKDTKAGPPDCGEFVNNPPHDLLLDNPDSFGCLAYAF